MTKQLSLHELTDAYLAARQHVGPTQRRVLAQLDQLCGQQRPDALTPEWQRGLNKKLGGADATRRRALGALQTVLNWGERRQLIPRAVQLDLPPPGQPREVFMDAAEAGDFHAKALAWGRFNGRVGVFVALALNTGARREAIEDLTWDRVDLAAGTVDFRVPGRAVSKKRRVAVPVNARLEAVLRAANRAPVDGSPYVVGECAIRYPYETFVSEIGMAWVTPHVLRHTSATLMLRAGHSLWDVAGVLGDSPATVARVYGHHSATHLRAAVSALG